MSSLPRGVHVAGRGLLVKAVHLQLLVISHRGAGLEGLHALRSGGERSLHVTYGVNPTARELQPRRSYAHQGRHQSWIRRPWLQRTKTTAQGELGIRGAHES